LVPNGELAATLARSAWGRPVVVFGGGPSAPRQWERVARLNPVVISANGHAARAGVEADYILCKDHRHSSTHKLMEDELRPLGIPIIGPHWWADYRMVNFPSQGNSGQLAIAFGVLMGGRPVIPVGIDCYQGQMTYFHGQDEKNVSRGRHPGTWAHSMTRLAKRLEDGGVVRVLDGPLRSAFPSLGEEIPEPRLPPAFALYATQRARHVKVVHSGTGPPVNWIYPMVEREAERATRMGMVVDFPLTV